METYALRREIPVGSGYDIVVAGGYCMDTTDGFYRLLRPEEHRFLADALGETPQTTASVHLLSRNACKAYVAGELSSFKGAIVQANNLPTEPVGFGSDPQALWELLQMVEGWDCILVDLECASAVGVAMVEQRGGSVRYVDDVYHVMADGIRYHSHAAVRRMTMADYGLLKTAPAELRSSLWTSTRMLLEEGIVACAVVLGKVVATALTAARSERYADVGVYTQEEFRGLGYSTAAAATVVREVQEQRQIPVWSSGAHNQASLRVAEKLGFVEFGRRRYAVPVSHQRGSH